MKKQSVIYSVVGFTLTLVVLMAMLIPAYRNIRQCRALVYSAVSDVSPTQLKLGCAELIERYRVPSWEYRQLDLNEDELPATLASIPVKTITVMHDCVEIWLDHPGRAGILCFAPDAQEYGTENITNGIWFWTGTPSRDTRANYEGWVKRNRGVSGADRAK